MDLHLLHAATEYLFVTRDTAWLNKKLPYAIDHSGTTATVNPYVLPVPATMPPSGASTCCCACWSRNLPCAFQCMWRLVACLCTLAYWAAVVCCSCCKKRRDRTTEVAGNMAG